MAHGSPDYSNVIKPQFTHKVNDLGEVVARLSKSQSIERRGEVLFFEDWEHGLTNWETFALGTGAEVVLASDKFTSKGFSVRLRGGSDSNRTSTINYFHPYLNISNFGLELRVLADASVEEYNLGVSYYDGAKQTWSKVRFITDSLKWQIFDDSVTYKDILTIVARPSPTHTFSFVKLVANFDDKVSSRFFFNENLVATDDYGLYNPIDTTVPGIKISIQSKSKTGLLGDIYVDNIVLTRNE